MRARGPRMSIKELVRDIWGRPCDVCVALEPNRHCPSPEVSPNKRRRILVSGDGAFETQTAFFSLKLTGLTRS